jgi:branched-subunit amino acid transport protein
MKRHRYLILGAAGLVVISILLYTLHYLIFRDPHHIAMFLVSDLAFLPIEVLLVVLIVERVLANHEKSLMLQKLNMVIGTFFTELGTGLLGDIIKHVENMDEVKCQLSPQDNWTEKDYKKAVNFAWQFDFRISQNTLDLDQIRQRLAVNRDLLVMLLANPNLLEHESFTELLWSTLHLVDELGARESLTDLPQADFAHIANDIRRVYSHLIVEWMHYCRHLQDAYPYMFSYLLRTHPLQDKPCATVKG